MSISGPSKKMSSTWMNSCNPLVFAIGICRKKKTSICCSLDDNFNIYIHTRRVTFQSLAKVRKAGKQCPGRVNSPMRHFRMDDLGEGMPPPLWKTLQSERCLHGKGLNIWLMFTLQMRCEVQLVTTDSLQYWIKNFSEKHLYWNGSANFFMRHSFDCVTFVAEIQAG